MDKRSSLLQKFVTYGHKKFYNIDCRSNICLKDQEPTLEGSSITVGLTYRYKALLERLVKDEHSSFFAAAMNDEEIKVS